MSEKLISKSLLEHILVELKAREKGLEGLIGTNADEYYWRVNGIISHVKNILKDSSKEKIC